jgi:thiamine pyrophosphate-dependent acetolactate synthase large subunit-like protein
MKEEMTHGGRVIGRVLKEEGVECLFGIMGMTWLIL